MPLYEYLCHSCGVQFEKMHSATIRHQKCPECGLEIPRNVSMGSAGFSTSVQGSDPQSSGFSSVDYEVDRIIGEDARQKWGVLWGRYEQKKRILLENPKITGKDLGRTEDNTYRILSPEGRKHYDRSMQLQIELAELKRKQQQRRG